MKRIIEWFKLSNRYKHAKYGMLVWLSVFIAGMSIWFSALPAAIISDIAVLWTMFALEFKDKQHGCLFDKNDIVAGMIFPVIITLLILIIVLI